MSKTRVWHPEDDATTQTQQKKQAEVKKSKSKKKTTKQSNMTNNFWDQRIKKEDLTVFRFMDDTEIQAIPLMYDTYHIKVKVDGSERIIYKHAIKWVSEASKD